MTAGASVLSDVVCALGEGPTWDPDRGVLVWFDITGRRLLERRLDRPGTTVLDIGVNGSVAARIDAGRQLIVADTGLLVRDLRDDRLSVLLPHEADDPTRRTNDGRVHPSGALWFSTMKRGFDAGQGTIWWYRGGVLRPIVEGLAIPNGIAFAPDGTHAYYACSVAATVWRVATDPATGLPAGDPAVFLTVPDGEGAPDGAVVDRDGVYWNARWGAGMVVGHDPDGRPVGRHRVPATQSSCPAFAGPGADRMAVTSAHEGMDAAARAADPLAGLTFLLDTPVRGVVDPPVRLG
jgi:sugar lactone lactonase YvrE